MKKNLLPISHKHPFISIVIPLHVYSKRFISDLKYFSLQKYKKFEVLIVCDKTIHLPKVNGVKIRVIYTHNNSTGPATKRDIAIHYAKGELIGFIDDDAYPDPQWIDSAICSFSDRKVVAVGGPGITPPDDGYLAKLSGLVYESRLCSGAARYRFVEESTRETDDYPAYNLFVRTSELKKVGGYGNDFYGGEDTFLCTKLNQIGKIIYTSEVKVYHHRRDLFYPLLSQIANVGLHRGYFARMFPSTSRRWFYFMPSLFFLSLFFFVTMGIASPYWLYLSIIAILSFILLGAISVWNKTSMYSAFIVGFGIFLVHMTYGIFFIKGLCTRRLVR